MATPDPNPKTAIAPTTTAAPAIVAEKSDSPWPEIERNYFTSMRLHREEEDRVLDAEYTAKSEVLREQLVDNYNAQAELLRRLQVLKAEYEGKQAGLEGLERELKDVKAARRAARAREDEERRAWFERYRRGGLAYRGVEASSEGAVVGSCRGKEREVASEWEEGFDCRVEPPSAGVGMLEMEDGRGDDGRTSGQPEYQQPSDLEQGRPGDGKLDNVDSQQHGGLGREQPNHSDKGAPDDRHLVNGNTHEVPQIAEQPADLEMGALNAEAASTGHEKEAQVMEAEMADAESLPSGSGHEAVVEGQPASVEESMPDTAPLIAGHQEEPPIVEKDMPDDGPLGNGHGQGEIHTTEHGDGSAAEHGMSEAVVLDDGVKMDGVEVIGSHELPKDVVVPEPNNEPSVDASRSGQPTANPALTADAEETGNKDTQLPIPKAGIPDDSETLDRRTLEEDVEMSDVRGSPDNGNNGPGLPEAVSQTSSAESAAGLPEAISQAASPAPAAPLSPSSSSELSSRHTTPALDTPVSFAKGHSPPATPEGPSSGVIEVLGESGDFLGRLQPPFDTNNSFVEAIRGRPVKRLVQIRNGRKFTADDLEAVPRPQSGDVRAFKFLSFYVQATGEQQARPCLDCSMNHGLYQGCVVLDDPDFPRCGNCEWNKRCCHGAALELGSNSRHNLPAKSPTKSPTKSRASGGSFMAVNDSFESRDSNDEIGEGSSSKEANTGLTKKGPRKSLPMTRKAAMPSTPSTKSVQANTDRLPEITKEVLCLRHDGVVYTDPPIMRGVPLSKISRDHPYWEPDWKPIEEIVEPIRQKYQAKFEQLDQSGSTHRDKHLASRDAKRGRTILKFLEEGELHPYQLVGKEWISYRITNYDTLFRLAHLLLEELPKMNLDVKPSDWLRHRLHEVAQEKGDKFDVASWIGKAYHDRKIEQLREKNGFPRVGRPPAHAVKNETGSSSKKTTVPRSLKRKDPHQTPESTPSKPKVTIASRPSPNASPLVATAAAAGQQKPKKIKIITSQPPPPPAGEPAPAKKPKIILNSPFPPSAAAEDDDSLDSALNYGGYTSTDSISGDLLHPNDWRLHQVKTRTFATNPHVTQYWHWVTEKKDDKVIEHQVLESVRPIKWSVFKKPYNFHLKLGDIQEVSFARGSTRVIVTHKKGKDGRDLNQRGDVMAQFKRERTKRRFLNFLARERGVKIAEVGKDFMESTWNALTPETLPGGDSD